jgi:hypothetical protein
VRAEDIRANPSTGDVIAVPGLLPGRAYETRSTPPALDPLDDGDQPARGAEVAPYLQLPASAPAELAAQAQRLASVAVGNGATARLEALASGMRREYAYSEAVPAGHGLPQLERFLFDDPASPDPMARRGTAEQFASAFTLMARSLGYPARLVIGFRWPQDAPADRPVPVFSDDLQVWSEVAFEGRGWVAFDPTPERVESQPPPLPRPEEHGGGGAAVPDDIGSDLPDLEPEELEEPARLPVDGRLLVGAPLAVLLLGGMAVVWLGKVHRRRSRRGAGSPAERVVGAWHEARDRLVETGLGRRAHLSPAELADASVEAAGADAAAALARLAPMVDEAIYSPDGPGDAAAETAWMELERFEEALAGHRPLGRRALAVVDPRPLVQRPRR